MAIAALAVAGENIVAAATISEETYTAFKYRLPAQGITVKFVDINNADSVHTAIDEMTRAIYIESISSVGLEIADISAMASIAHEAGVPLIVWVHPGRCKLYRERWKGERALMSILPGITHLVSQVTSSVPSTTELIS